jgi:hypothetical protein
MDDNTRLGRIEDKLDSVADRLSSIDITLAKQHASLEEHMRRSIANEAAIELVRQTMKPLEKASAMTEGAWKLVGVVTGVAAMIETLYLLLTHVR